MTTWYDPAETQAMADGAQTQPEFDEDPDVLPDNMVYDTEGGPDETMTALEASMAAIADIAAESDQ